MPKRTKEQIAQSIFINRDTGIASIVLTRGKTAIIDADDVPLASGVAWVFHSCGYAYTSGLGEPMTLLHRLIMKPSKGFVVDHINHDKLDNRRENLRVTTQSHNLRNGLLKPSNKSGHIGVCWDKSRQKWMASMRVNYKMIHIGRFSSLTEAAEAREKALRDFNLVTFQNGQ